MIWSTCWADFALLLWVLFQKEPLFHTPLFVLPKNPSVIHPLLFTPECIFTTKNGSEIWVAWNNLIINQHYISWKYLITMMWTNSSLEPVFLHIMYFKFMLWKCKSYVINPKNNKKKKIFFPLRNNLYATPIIQDLSSCNKKLKDFMLVLVLMQNKIICRHSEQTNIK